MYHGKPQFLGANNYTINWDIMMISHGKTAVGPGKSTTLSTVSLFILKQKITWRMFRVIPI
jgi:hypothetical protein